MVEGLDEIKRKKEELQQEIELLEEKERELENKQNNPFNFLGNVVGRIVSPIQSFFGLNKQDKSFDDNVRETFEGGKQDIPSQETEIEKKRIGRPPSPLTMEEAVKESFSAQYASKREREEKKLMKEREEREKQFKSSSTKSTKSKSLFPSIIETIQNTFKEREKRIKIEEKEKERQIKEQEKIFKEQERIRKQQERQQAKIEKQRSQYADLIKQLQDVDEEEQIEETKKKKEIEQMHEGFFRREQIKAEERKKLLRDKKITEKMSPYEIDKYIEQKADLREKEDKTPLTTKILERVRKAMPGQKKEKIEDIEIERIRDDSTAPLGEQQYERDRKKKEFGGIDVSSKSEEEKQKDIEYERKLITEYKEKYGSRYKEELDKEMRRRETEFEYAIIKDAKYKDYFIKEGDSQLVAKDELETKIKKDKEKGIVFLDKQLMTLEKGVRKKTQKDIRERYKALKKGVLEGSDTGIIYGSSIEFSEVDKNGVVLRTISRYTRVHQKFEDLSDDIVTRATQLNRDIVNSGSDKDMFTTHRWIVTNVILHHKTFNPNARYNYDPIEPFGQYSQDQVKMVNIRSGLILQQEPKEEVQQTNNYSNREVIQEDEYEE